MATQEGKEMVVVGDFNCNVLHPDSCTEELMPAADVCNLKQLITTPTHITSNSESLIDLLLVTHPDRFPQVGCLEVTDSDHLMIFGVYSEAVKVVSHGVKKVRSFKKCDGEKLCCELLEAPWLVMDSFDTIDEKWEYWRSLFLSVVDDHDPMHCEGEGETRLTAVN